ncbi:MAG: NINE protein [Flavobacteriaceae bacterium]
MEKQAYEKYCPECGALINSNAEYCPKCGAAQPNISNNSMPRQTPSDNRWLITLILCFFLGGLGIHRFFNGKIGTGILMILTLGGLGIWVLIDLILIVTGNFTDENGEYLKP